MFHGVSSSYEILELVFFPSFNFRSATAKLLDENYVCDSIVDAIRKNKRLVMLPPHTILFYILKGYRKNKIGLIN
jgi:hypothetical protein